MAKGKRVKSDALRKAVALRAVYRKWLMLFIGALALSLAVLGVYWLLVIQMVIDSSSLDMLPWALALVAAGVIGILGNKFSRAHREYEAFLDSHGMGEFDVKEFIKNNR